MPGSGRRPGYESASASKSIVRPTRTLIDRHLRRKDKRAQAGPFGLSCPHWSTVDWLDSRDGSVCFTHLREICQTLAMPNDACAVPTVAQAMKPPLTIISGLAPKFSGFQSTKSARQPFATWPTMCEIPWQMALRGENNQIPFTLLPRRVRSRIDRVFRNVSLDSLVVATFDLLAWQRSSDVLHLGRRAPRSRDDFADTTHRL